MYIVNLSNQSSANLRTKFDLDNRFKAQAIHAVGRSTENIADWTSYLPADCIETMVSLGWDHTT
jgi:hypothetical protein